MKTVKLVAILAMMCAPFLVVAQCPTQETTLFFANGVNVDYGEAEESMVRLYDELKLKTESGFRTDCVRPDLAYNTNEPTFITDFVEALIQKTAEQTGVDNFPWGQWLLAETPLEYYQAFIKDALFLPVKGAIDAGRFVLGDQRDEHIAKFKTEIGLGRQVLLASHSQGSVNSKEERTIMTEAEQLSTRIVSAAAFSFPEPDETRYTTLSEDNLAFGGFGFPTPPANIILGGFLNPSPCRLPTPLPVYCHDFIQAYMTIPEARDKIVADIIASLPTVPETATLQGYTYRLLFDGSATVLEGEALVSLRDYDTGVILSETTSGIDGFYSFSAASCAHCSIDASKFIPSDGVTYQGSIDDFEIVPGSMYNLDVTMFPPPVSN
jgi:hypothetical protein